MNLDDLFPPIDEKKTIKQVRKFLDTKFHQAIRASGRSVTDIKASTIDGMPKSDSFDNLAEKRITKRLYAEQIVMETIKAMSCCDNECQEILDNLYIKGYSNTRCCMEIGYSRTQYFVRWKPMALLQFAQSYSLEDLNVYIDEP